MSYEIVKGIEINEQENKVYINSACNNCRPLYYEKIDFPYFSNLLKEQGKEKTEIELLRNYEEGNLQQGNKNKFTRALKVLRYLYGEEYNKFNWKNFSYDERDKEQKLRNSQEFKDLLLKALKTKLPKEKFVLYRKHDNFKEYVLKETTRHIFFTMNRDKAKKYDFKEETEHLIKSKGYEIEQF